jgi:hypothetical protein
VVPDLLVLRPHSTARTPESSYTADLDLATHLYRWPVSNRSPIIYFIPGRGSLLFINAARPAESHSLEPVRPCRVELDDL